MLLIPCPCCGPRVQTEFTYTGDATLTRPADDADDQAWIDYVYLRDNPKGPHDEVWQHTSGCRRFVKVRRDTASHDIIASGAPNADFDGGIE